MTAGGFFFNDDKAMVGDFIDKDWSLSQRVCKKPVIKCAPDTDPNTFNYALGDTLCNIKFMNLPRRARGIGFDGYEVKAICQIYVYARSDEVVINTVNEIDRIMSEHALFPGNGWNWVESKGVSQLYPTAKFTRCILTYEFNTPWKSRREISLNNNVG